MLEQEGFVYKESGLGTKVLSNLTLLGQHDSPVNSFAGPVQKDLGRVDLLLPAQEAAYQVWRGLLPKADLPDKYDRQYLGANESTPILEIEQIVWTNSGVNLEYSRSRNLYNNRSYIMVETSH